MKTIELLDKLNNELDFVEKSRLDSLEEKDYYHHEFYRGRKIQLISCIIDIKNLLS